MAAPTEPLAWVKAGDHDGLELPDELLELVKRARELRAKATELGSQRVERVRASTEQVHGASPEEARAAQERAEEEAERLDELRRETAEAARIADLHVKHYIAAHRSELIVGPLREAVDVTLERARAVAKVLKRFAPTFPEKDIIRRAKPNELEAWRESRDLDASFQAYVTAWFATWKSATSGMGSTQVRQKYAVPDHLRPGTPGGWHVWERPHDVTDVDVRDGIRGGRDVLRVAYWSEAGGYCLKEGQELLDLTQRTPVYRPWVAGERSQRRVILPDPDPEPEPEPPQVRMR